MYTVSTIGKRPTAQLIRRFERWCYQEGHSADIQPLPAGSPNWGWIQGPEEWGNGAFWERLAEIGSKWHRIESENQKKIGRRN
jgi:hypothetical protein